ncbi:rhTRS1 [macacine betaherpesvirus 3]|uniref:RhTRS1 n=1 Tax=Rhesus cytomegalovirus (strain 68-1) TaxID=47929 RepID=Q2FA67_RHCM6|nr:rhTRS1 [macacine betaherpesvirus 3]QXV50553.1 tegument protein TRS1 [macacine betaherpesvirus 3]
MRPHRSPHSWQHLRYAGLRTSPDPHSHRLPAPPTHWRPHPPSPLHHMSGLMHALPTPPPQPTSAMHPPTHAPGAPTTLTLPSLDTRTRLASIPPQQHALTKDEFLLMATAWADAFIANTTARATRKWCQRQTGQLLPLGRPANFYAVVTPRSHMRDVGATDLRQLSPTDDWIVLVATLVHEMSPSPQDPPTLCRHEGLFLAIGCHFRVFLFDLPRHTLHLAATDADDFFRHGIGDLPRVYACPTLPPLTVHPPEPVELLSRTWPNAAAAAAAIGHTAAGQTICLQTPGRPPQPCLLTTCWEEVERWQPFCKWPHAGSIVAAVRNFISERLCCAFHLLGIVTTHPWLEYLSEWAAARANWFDTRSRNPSREHTRLAAYQGSTVKRRPKPNKHSRHNAPASDVPPAATPGPAAAAAAATVTHSPKCHAELKSDERAEVDDDGRLLEKNPLAVMLIIIDELGVVYGYCTYDGLVYPLAEDLSHFLRVGLLAALTAGYAAASPDQAAVRLLPDQDPYVWERPRPDALYLWPRPSGGPRDLASQFAFLTRPGRWRLDTETSTCQSRDEDGWRVRDAQALALPAEAGQEPIPQSHQALVSRALRFDLRYWKLPSGPEEDEDPGEDDSFTLLPYRTWAVGDYNPHWDPQSVRGPNTVMQRRICNHRARANRPFRRPLPIQPRDRDPSVFPKYSSDGVLIVPC